MFVLVLYTLTIFLSALLLVVVQPMFTRLVLPPHLPPKQSDGGTSSVHAKSKIPHSGAAQSKEPMVRKRGGVGWGQTFRVSLK